MKFSIVVLLLVGALCLQAQWAVAQFIIQDDLGLYYLGETQLDSAKAGIAKFTSNDPGSAKQLRTKVVRSYGPYAHPNSLAGAMLIGLMLLLLLKQRGGIPHQTSYISISLSLALFFSFSRSGWVGALLLALAYIYFNRESWLRYALIVSVFLLLASPLWYSRINDGEDVALADRVAGSTYAWNFFSDSVIVGSGPGLYERVLVDYFSENNIEYMSWHVAPVHNAFLLLAIEWGVVPFMILFLITCWAFWLEIKAGWYYIVAILPALILDHYFVTQLITFALFVLFVGYLFITKPSAKIDG